VQSRDSVQNFLEVAESWNITDGVSHSLAVSREVHCNSAPFQHSAYDRTVLQQGLLRAVATEAINYILQRKTPVASVVHEQYMPMHEKVAVVGELKSVSRGPNLRPFSSNAIRVSPKPPPHCPAPADVSIVHEHTAHPMHEHAEHPATSRACCACTAGPLQSRDADGLLGVGNTRSMLAVMPPGVGKGNVRRRVLGSG
jgi:hypothetical protein